MQLNIFLPYKKSTKGLTRVLKSLGPTWLSAPGRRSAQTLCLILFLVLFFYFCLPYRNDYSKQADGQLPDAVLFLVLDPLVSISTAIASRTLAWSLAAAAVVLITAVVFPRWFCGYVCPLGTIIDLFDWSICRHIKIFRINRKAKNNKTGFLIQLRFFILAAVLCAAVFGVLLSGFFSAIPIVTRGMMYIFAPVQLGLMNGWKSVPPLNVGHYISIVVFLSVLLLGLLRPRFWCAYLCPSGALLSLTSFIRLTERQVGSSCIKCGACIKACSFDAINPDYSTRRQCCTFCQSCGGVCPTTSIKFVSSRNIKNIQSKKQTINTHVIVEPAYERRQFLFNVIGAVGGAGAATAIANQAGSYTKIYPVRPPGSVPEDIFRRQCVRCGQCLKVCPGSVLQPAALELGIDGLWTPKVVAEFSGCKPFCNNCGQVCPTEAIRELPLEEKRAARIGLAEVNKKICLPHSLRQDCGLCQEECAAAGYNAIEFIRVGLEYDRRGSIIAGSGFLAPVVLEDKCVGCGLCQERCHKTNVKEKKLLDQSAIKVQAGPGKEDRIINGSYLSLQKERAEIKKSQKKSSPDNEYLPDFLR
jgi:ferredoxin